MPGAGAPLILPAPAALRGDVLADASAVLPARGSDVATDPGSWWPSNDVDDRERLSAPSPSATPVRHVRAALIVALVVLGIAGAAQLFAPLNGRVEQVRPPVDPSTSPVTLGIAGITTPSTLDPTMPSAPVTTANSEAAQNVTAEVTSESGTPTLTTVPTTTTATTSSSTSTSTRTSVVHHYHHDYQRSD